MSRLTHRKKIARRLAETASVSYQQALVAVIAAADAGVLVVPGRALDEDVSGAAERALPYLPHSDGASAIGVPALSSGAAAPFVFATSSDGSPFVLTQEDLLGHVAVFGQPGSGKSVTARRLVEMMLAWGWDGVVVDPHGEAGEWVRACARSSSAPLASLRVDDSSAGGSVDDSPASAGGPVDDDGSDSSVFVDALQGLSGATVAELVLSGVDGWDDYRRAVGTRLVSSVWESMVQAHRRAPQRFEPATFESLLTLLESGFLVDGAAGLLAGAAVGEARSFSPEEQAFTVEVAAAARTRVGSHRARLAYTGAWDRGGVAAWDGLFSWAVNAAPGLIHVEVSCSRRGLQEVVLGAVMQHCQWAVLRRSLSSPHEPRMAASGGRGSARRFVVVESAGDVPGEMLAGLLARARGAGLVVVLVAQEPPSMWSGVSPAVASQMQSNVGVVMSHRATTPRHAAAVGEMLGLGGQEAAVLRDLGPGWVCVGSRRVDPGWGMGVFEVPLPLS